MTRVVVRDELEAVIEEPARQALSHSAKPYESDRAILRNHCPKTPFEPLAVVADFFGFSVNLRGVKCRRTTRVLCGCRR
jgi:hypothetical protein